MLMIVYHRQILDFFLTWTWMKELGVTVASQSLSSLPAESMHTGKFNTFLKTLVVSMREAADA